MEIPKDQINALLDNGLSASAQILGSFLVSSSSGSAETSPHLKAENMVLLGDALLKEKEYRRAIHAYNQALQYHKICPKQTSAVSRSSLSASTRSSSPSSFSVSTVNENEVKYTIASCHCSLNENKAYLLELEGVPSKARNLQMHLLMGKLYRNSRHNRAAIACYKECLSVFTLTNQPKLLGILSYPAKILFKFLFLSGTAVLSFEAIIALAEMGATPKDIISLFPQDPSRGNRASLEQPDSMRWLHRYVEAHCCIASNDYKGGLDIFPELLQRFPNNVHVILEIAKVEAIIGKNDAAISNFEKARSIDPYIVTYMDEYATLLKMKSDNTKLGKLLHDLLNIDSTRPEVFVTLSVMWERKDEKGALSHAEKSIRIDERHVLGYITKGNLYLSMGRPEAGVVAFRGAHDLRPDLRSYQGLVRSYLACSKVKEALFVAREAMKSMPQSAKAIKLVGDVHVSNNSAGRDKAKRFYESALRLEPGYLGAALALAEVHVTEGRDSDAVSLLEKYLKDWPDDSLHVKLAQIFSTTNMLQEALLHYQYALRINPQYEAAKKGLDRLEKLMKGVDPDVLDKDEDNDVDDGEGDQEDTDLL